MGRNRGRENSVESITARLLHLSFVVTLIHSNPHTNLDMLLPIDTVLRVAHYTYIESCGTIYSIGSLLWLPSRYGQGRLRLLYVH
jgi:hypothetical protein